MSKTLQEVLDTELSPDNVRQWSISDLVDYLLEYNIVASVADLNCLIVEGIQNALNDDDEFPIHYYDKHEPMSEQGKYVEVGDCLTDDYIENNM